MNFELADRIKELPPYLFDEIDKLKKKCISEGADIVNLGVGDPDLPTPEPIIKLMKTAIENTVYHQYPSYRGEGFFRKDSAEYMKNRFGVELEPETEVIVTIGSKEGIANFPQMLINPGDYALIPEPCYPVLPTAVKFLGGKIHYLPLLEENYFLPDYNNIPLDILKKSKLLYLNYPNNPTGAMATIEYLEGIIEFAIKNNIIILYDNAYSEVLFDGSNPLSILSIKGGKECAIEFHSLSKIFNMTGWRIGFACANKKIIDGFAKVKTNIDSGAFAAIQEVAGQAITKHMDLLEGTLAIYRERREIMRNALTQCGLTYYNSKSTFYVWVKTPENYNSADFSTELLTKLHIVVTPGNGFGDSGEGYIRMSLTASTENIKKAAERLINDFKEKIKQD